MPTKQTLKKYQWLIVAGVALVIIIVGALALQRPRVAPIPPADTMSEFQSGNFSFSYPRLYQTKEYAIGVAALGGTAQNTFIPLIDVVRYQSDLQSALPASFDAFATHQIESLCGSDGGVSLTCTNPVEKPYTTAAGLKGKEISLTLVSKNLKTGVATSTTYGPIFVFETTNPSATPKRYEGVFVYPDFSSFVIAPNTGGLVAGVASTIKIVSGTGSGK